MSTYRTFIAIEIPSDIRQRIKEHVDQLHTSFPDVRASWSRADHLHLTLKFLGDVAVDRISALSAACAQAAQTIASFELIIKGCGAFPPHGRPKVLWIGVRAGACILPASSAPDPKSANARTEVSTESGSDRVGARNADIPSAPSSLPLALSSLHLSIENACAAAGFEREARPFHPHLTIARLRESKGARALAEHHKQLAFPPQPFTVSELVLFRSELSSKGSKHTALSRHGHG